MTPELRKAMRVALLLIARKAPLGLTIETAEVMLPIFGQRVERQEIADETLYLEDKGLLARVPASISPEIKAWRPTAAGRDFLAEEGHE